MPPSQQTMDVKYASSKGLTNAAQFRRRLEEIKEKKGTAYSGKSSKSKLIQDGGKADTVIGTIDALERV